MKTNIVLLLFAAIVKNFFPQLAVKRFTKKNNPNVMLYLPETVEEQLHLIEKLALSAEQLRERVWLLDTKVALFRKGEYALLPEIRTQKEFDAIAASASIELVISAIKYYTPNKAGILYLLNLYGVEAVEIAKAAPAAFDVLRPWEILGVTERETCPLDNKRWAIAEALVNAKTSWAPLFMRELQKITPLGEQGKALFAAFFHCALSARENIADLLPYMAICFPQYYAKVREEYFCYENISPYFCTMFPRVFKFLYGHNDIKDLSSAAICGELVPWADAYAWLAIGFRRLSEPGVFDCILSSLTDIKHRVSTEVFDQLFSQMVKKAASASSIKRLIDCCEERYVPILRAKLAQSGASRLLLGFFPFKDWDVKTAKMALGKLAAASMISAERIDELAPELRTFAIQSIDLYAQICAVQNNVLQAVEYHLCPAAEKELFGLESQCQKYKLMYISKYKMTEESFLYMLNRELKYCEERQLRLELVWAHARKWGLTPIQYLAIQQSSIRDESLALKGFVRPEETEQGIGGECTL